MKSPRRKPLVAIVGAGRVGRALGWRLRHRGWRIGPVVTRSPRSARAAVRAIGAGEPSAYLAASVLDADVILISTPDAAIAAVARELAESVRKDASGAPPLGFKGGVFDLSFRRKVVLHSCGAMDRTVLRPLELRGANTGTLHPLQTFAGRGLPQLEGYACAIDGNAAAMRTAQRICRELGCVPIHIPGKARAVYHAAAVFAAGHVLGAVEAATRILMAIGLPRQKAVRALLPLTRQTLANFERYGGPRSWTGPARRGDLETIRRHLVALSRFPREYRMAYEALTRLSVLLLTRKARIKTR